jgi:hypothetical protein
MTINIKENGSWKPAKQVFVKDGGVWKEVKSSFIKDGGAWKEEFRSGTPPVILTNGTISGTGAVQSSLTYTTATFSGTPTPTVTWAWFADAAQVAGQVSSYTPTEAQIGKAITVKATATNAGGSVIATSNSVTVRGVAPVLTNNGAISGDPKQGSVLSYSTKATFSGIPTPTVTWQWKSGSDTVQSGGDTYITKVSDVGKQVYVLATGTNSAGSAQGASTSITVTPAVSNVSFTVELYGGGGALGWNGQDIQGQESRGGYARYNVQAPENGRVRFVAGRGCGANQNNGTGYTNGGARQEVGNGSSSGGGGGSSGMEFAPSGQGFTWVAIAGGGGGCGKQQANVPTGENGFGYGRQGSPSNGSQGGREVCDPNVPIVSCGGGGGGGASGGSGGGGSCGNPQGGQGGGGNYQQGSLPSAGGNISLVASTQGNSRSYGGSVLIFKQSGGTIEVGEGEDRIYNVSDLR